MRLEAATCSSCRMATLRDEQRPGLRSDVPPEAVLEFFGQMASASAPLEVIEGGGGPERAHVVCGFLGCDIHPFNPVLEALPRALYLRGRKAREPAIDCRTWSTLPSRRRAHHGPAAGACCFT